jgi:hypothetical protein
MMVTRKKKHVIPREPWRPTDLGVDNGLGAMRPLKLPRLFIGMRMRHRDVSLASADCDEGCDDGCVARRIAS